MKYGKEYWLYYVVPMIFCLALGGLMGYVEGYVDGMGSGLAKKIIRDCPERIKND